MHYYQFNIGDYVKSTRYLTNDQDLIYRRLLDLHYDTEKPLTSDLNKLCRVIGYPDSKSCLELVLGDFFDVNESGEYYQKRVMEEITKYHAKSEVAKINGSKGGRPRKETTQTKPKKTQSVNLANLKKADCKLTKNHKPITNNHKPLTKVKDIALTLPDFEDKKIEKSITEFIEHRRQIKKPMTQLALDKFMDKINNLSNDGYNVIQLIDNSISNGWQSVYPKPEDKIKSQDDDFINYMKSQGLE